MEAVREAGPATEGELVERYRASGDGRVFEQLYRLARRRVYGVCVKILRDGARAEDACQEAFVRAYRRFESLRGERFTAWACRIAANHCYDEIERNAREVAAPEPDELLSAEERLVVDASSAERLAISRQALGRARDIIRGLDEHQRRVFLLFHLGEHSYAEIEAETGYSYKQVKTYLQNARRNFEIAWRGFEEETVEKLS